MARYRSILAFILAGISAFLVSCGSPNTAVKPPTYTAAQLEQIQESTANLQVLRDRLLEIPPLVQRKRWRDVETFIHGPLGELRSQMSRITRNLAPDVQTQAQQAAKGLFGHLENIDEAARALDARKALSNYNAALEDFDAFLKLIPSA